MCDSWSAFLPSVVRDHNLHSVWLALKMLVTPSKNPTDPEIVDSVFNTCMENAMHTLGFDDKKRIPSLSNSVDVGSSITWEYVEAALYTLISLKKALSEEDLSVSQQKDVRSCLQFVVSLGLCPNLLPGVGLPLSCRSTYGSNLKVEDVNVLNKYNRLCTVVKSFLYCCENTTLRALIVGNIFEDVLAGLIQLSFAPLRKPCQGDGSSDNSQSDCIMSLDLWLRCQKDQEFFARQLLKLLKETHQPTVMEKLMILQAGQKQCKPPIWMKKKCASLLTHCLIQPGGVASLIRVTFDSVPDIGADWEKVETVARLISSSSNHSKNIAGQLSKLLRSSSTVTPSVLVVALACVKQLMIVDAVLCQTLIIDPLLLPFLKCCSSDVPVNSNHIILSEEALVSSLDCIFTCFLSTGSEACSYSLPKILLIPCVSFLFKLYCKVNGSASILFSQVENLLFQILCSGDISSHILVLKSILFDESVQGIPAFSPMLCFNFGPNGSVQVEKAPEEEIDFMHFSVEEAGDNLILLLEHQDSNQKMTLTVFLALMAVLNDIGLSTSAKDSQKPRLETVEDTLKSLILSSQRQLGIVRLLAVLSESHKVQAGLAADPTPFLKLLLSLLHSASLLVTDSSANCENDDSGLHCVFVSLMILNVMLEKCDEHSNWSAFKQVLSPIAVLRDGTRDPELSRLASNVYNTIVTHGVLQTDRVHCKDTKSKKTRCENALHDSCDPLLPVRGHAIVELTKLLWQRDSETVSKKDAIFCVLQENLKNEDSFIYLAAINAMVALAALEPEKAVKSLVHEYVECSTAGDSSGKNADLRMKVGEVLVKLTNALGEMAPRYKTELLNAYLVGVRDIDHLMRASSLSNLGEVCRILGFRIGSILQEIFICVESVVKFDKAVEPRRAAVMVINHLLQGLGKDTFDVLQDILLDLYRSLKYVYLNDTDDVVRLHAELALQELGTITENFLFPKCKLEKKVQLL